VDLNSCKWKLLLFWYKITVEKVKFMTDITYISKYKNKLNFGNVEDIIKITYFISLISVETKLQKEDFSFSLKWNFYGSVFESTKIWYITLLLEPKYDNNNISAIFHAIKHQLYVQKLVAKLNSMK
jgi:hypothetical protein